MKMSPSFVLTTLSVLLGAFYMYMGAVKVSPTFGVELHRELRKDFVKHAKVFPFAEKLGMKVPAKYFRRVTGISEMICGMILVFIPYENFKFAANIQLVAGTILQMYSHLVEQDKFEKTAPLMVYSFLLIGRLTIHYLQRMKDIKLVAEQQHQTDTKTAKVE